MSIERILNLKFPIYWNGWPIGKKFSRYLIHKIITHRPVNIVELGSGTSSLLMLKALNKLGYDYKLISFDSSRDFLEGTRNLLISENVYDKEKVKLVFAPIKDLKINGLLYKWYDVKKFEFDFDKIDLLFVDGPVGSLCKNSRYPAMQIMKDYLGEGSLVILHDAKRADELEIVEMWKEENSKIRLVYEIDTDRGGAEIVF